MGYFAPQHFSQMVKRFGRLCYQQLHPQKHEILQSIASLWLGGLRWNFCKSSNLRMDALFVKC
jgi:hypothetical protein